MSPQLLMDCGGFFSYLFSRLAAEIVINADLIYNAVAPGA